MSTTIAAEATHTIQLQTDDQPVLVPGCRFEVMRVAHKAGDNALDVLLQAQDPAVIVGPVLWRPGALDFIVRPGTAHRWNAWSASFGYRHHASPVPEPWTYPDPHSAHGRAQWVVRPSGAFTESWFLWLALSGMPTPTWQTSQSLNNSRMAHL